ncbi:MAG: spore coat associated protein CotJA [Anaerocolumna sp.]|jgi:hypothetical protein|nr:spore coat associated protein CotJA [Anaerocolumna sp.]
MDNYRQQMYSRYNRRGAYQNAANNYGDKSCVEAVREERKSDYCDEEMAEKCLDKLPLAMAYVPFQKWKNVYDAATGLAHGTIFPELNLPFYGDKNCFGMRGDRS